MKIHPRTDVINTEIESEVYPNDKNISSNFEAVYSFQLNSLRKDKVSNNVLLYTSKRLYIQNVSLWFRDMWKHGTVDETICGKQVGISSRISDLFLLNFSCTFDPADPLSYWSTEQGKNPNTVNGNLGIILHAAQEMWKAGARRLI